MRFIAMIAPVVILTGPAYAQSQCGPLEDVLSILANKYTESTVAVGMADNGMALQVIASPKGGSWTIIALRPDGIACILATGHDWSTVLAPKTGREG